MADGLSNVTSTNPSTITVTLSDEERDDWTDVCLSVAEKFAGEKIDNVLVDVEEMAASGLREILSTGHRACIEDYQHNPDAVALHLFNTPFIPKDLVPPTPWKKPNPKTESFMVRSDVKILGVTKAAGYSAFASPKENQGRVMRNVIVADGAEKTKSSHGSDEFSSHMDNPTGNISSEGSACTLIPRILAFDPIRNDENVATYFSPTVAYLEHVSHGTFERLQDPEFDIRPPDSNEISLYTPELRSSPILARDENGEWLLRYDPGCVDARDPNSRHAEALEELRAVLARVQPVNAPVLKPGEFLMFKNRQVLHGRKAFVPLQPRHVSRWLRRVYAA